MCIAAPQYVTQYVTHYAPPTQANGALQPLCADKGASCSAPTPVQLFAATQLAEGQLAGGAPALTAMPLKGRCLQGAGTGGDVHLTVYPMPCLSATYACWPLMLGNHVCLLATTCSTVYFAL